MHTFKIADPADEGKPNFPDAFFRETLMVQLYNYDDPKNVMPPLCFELKVNEGGGLRGPVAVLLNKDRLQDGRKLLKMVHKKCWLLSSPAGFYTKECTFNEDWVHQMVDEMKDEFSRLFGADAMSCART